LQLDAFAADVVELQLAARFSDRVDSTFKRSDSSINIG
jgi:hypothetical protein